MSRLDMVGQIMTPNKHSISTETLLELLANPERRTVLHHLRNNGDGAVSIDELGETIAVDGGVNMERRADAETRVSVELHHTHLPKLADAGVIEYDPRGKTVRYRPNERVEQLLQFVETEL